MTTNGDSVPNADENNKNLENTAPLAMEVSPMEVDKVEENDSADPDRPKATKEREEDPREVYGRKAQQFLKELHKFHENAGTPIVRHPKINGKDIDLYELYTEMTKLGGWVKVNQRNDWDELLENLDFPKSCVNAAVAIKYIYIRYLDRYEKTQFLGEEVERVDEDDEDVRQKKMSSRFLHNVPMSYNHAQHFVSDANRLAHKLSTDFYKPTQNEKLFLSLLSPLPNEQNFAINVCMLISNEPVATLVNLDKCPKLIDALLAHAGVYSHYSLREVFTEFYSSYRKHSLQTFWNDCLSDKPHILELSFGDISESLDGEIVSIDDKESEGAQEAAQHEVISSFLNLKRGSGTQDYIGLRVQQIATILRNLSFVEENSFLFANSRTFLRFLVLCSNIRWNNLHHMALDMLGNVAEDIELSDPVTDDLTRCLLSTIIDGLESEDRGVIISCMEVLYKLCRRSSNEDYLFKAFDKSLYHKITSFLWLKDAMLVMYTLECMYAMTNMGEKTCIGFVHVRGIIDSLVSLVTLEAKTFGQEGCILMCVVDKMPGTVTTTKSVVVGGQAAGAIVPQVTSSPVKNQAVLKSSPVVQQSPVTSQKVAARTANPPSANKSTPLTSKQSQQQANQENEQYAQEWLRSTYEAVEGTTHRIDMHELYRLYVTSMSKLKRGGVVSPAFFPKIVKLVFGANAGPVKDQGAPFYTGLRSKKAAMVTPSKPAVTRVVTIPTNKPTFTVKASPASKPNTIIQQVTPDGTHVITTVAAAQAAAAAAANQQGVNPASVQPQQAVTTTSGGGSGMTVTPIVSASVITSQAQNVSHQHKQQQQQQHHHQQQSMPGPSVSQAPSSLIKSLLANKVTAAQVVVTQSPTKTVVAKIPQRQPQFIPQSSQQDPKKTQFYINPTNTNPTGQMTGIDAQPPPAGAVAAASVIMSSVAAQSGKPTASVPINSNKMQQSPNKTLIGIPTMNNSHPQLILSATSSTNNPSIIASNALNVRQVAQRQQLQKQKELAQRNLHNTTLKQGIITNMSTNPIMDSNQPPPLAPLSGGSSQKVTVLKINPTSQGTPVIIAANPPQSVVVSNPASTKDVETISLANQLDGMTPPFEDDEEDAATRQSKVTANKMLADLLEKKSDPPQYGEGTSSGGAATAKTTAKRKTSGESDPAPRKRKSSDEPAKATPSAANLYAEMAASILEDEDSIEDGEEEEDTEEDISMEEEAAVIQTSVPPTSSVSIKSGQATKTIIIPGHQAEQGKNPHSGPSGQQQVITLPLRQQIIMSPNSNQQQVILAGSHTMSGGQQTATIKTDSGYQTVPILMQHNQQQAASAAQANVTGGAGGAGQASIIQRPTTTAVHAGQTQYVLATNPQGQTYVVATQSPMQQQMQTLLVTQTPQQQGTQQKTIIILQQQPNQAGGGGGQATATPIQQAISNQGQKIIMTTPQGQQVMMTGGGGGGGGGVGATITGGSQPNPRQIVIQGQHQTGSNIIVQSTGGAAGGQVQKQIILSGGANVVQQQQPQQQTQYAVKAPAPMDAISSVENIPQHIIKTSTGLQIKPVHMGQAPGATQQQQPPLTPVGQKAVITAVQQPMQPTAASTVIQGGKISQASSVPLATNPGPSTTTTVVSQPTIATTVANMIQQPPMTVSVPVLSSSSTSSSPIPQSSPKLTTGLSTVAPNEAAVAVTTTVAPQQTQSTVVVPANDNGVDINWPYVCDWRGCPRKKFRSAEEVFYHACKAHCPDTLDFDAEIFCQWGPGPNLCDAKPRKRFSLMTHFQDRHCTEDKFIAAVQRRLEKGIATSNLTHPITIIRDVTKDAEAGGKKEDETAAAAKKQQGKPGTWQPTAEAVSIIKRREFKDNEFTKAWKDDNEGPVSISIRLTASLILRNLVTYSDVAKRMLKSHETHLSQIALSNVESSRTIAQVLYEMNDIHPV